MNAAAADLRRRTGPAARLRAIALGRLEAARELHALAPHGVRALGPPEGADDAESEHEHESKHEGEGEGLLVEFLATFLDARDRCLARIAADDAEWRALAASAVADPDPADQALLAEVREIGREIGALLETIAAEDAAFLAALAARRERVAASLELARGGRSAHRAYAPSASGSAADAPRFMDRRC